MIRIESVSKRYGRRTALSNVSFDLGPGQIALLLGANGAGKSTLLRCLLGVTDYEGSITVAGLDPLRHGCAVRSLIGYMPQSGGLHPDLTVDDTVRLYAEIRRVSSDRGATLLEEAGLIEHRQTRVGDLSGGMRQRLGFVLALLTDPPILILDEPSASLDAASRAWLAARLRAMAQEGRTVLVSTHAGQELLDVAGPRIVLEDGRCTERPAAIAPADGGSGEDHPSAASGTARPLLVKEIKDAIGNRWLAGYAVLLGALGFAAAVTGIDSSSGLALQAFGRTTATLTNLCLLLAPLVAILMGASSIAGERERGTLEHLLAQPLSRRALLAAKYSGLLVSLTLATVAGFIPAGVLIVREAGPAVLGQYVVFPAIAGLVGAAMLGLGMLVSVSSKSAVQAQGTAVFVWFGSVLLVRPRLDGVAGDWQHAGRNPRCCTCCESDRRRSRAWRACPGAGSLPARAGRRLSDRTALSRRRSDVTVRGARPLGHRTAAHREHPVFTSATFLAHVDQTPATQDSIFTTVPCRADLSAVARSAKVEAAQRRRRTSTEATFS